MTLSRIPMVLANEIAAMTLPPLLVMIVIILALCTCLFRVIWVTVCQKLGLDIHAVSLVYFASWTLTSIVFVIYYLRGNWLKRRISVMGYAPEVKKAKT